jgi:hypothetical protein
VKKQIRSVLSHLTAIFAVWAGINDMAMAVEVAQVNLTEWTPPDIKTVGDDPVGKLVKFWLCPGQ